MIWKGGFVTLSQLCASHQPSTTTTTEANFTGLNSQWDVTESQLQVLDNVCRNVQYGSEVENAECRTADRIQHDENVLQEEEEKTKLKELNPSDRTSKRRSSELESILSEWQSTSPTVKMRKKESMPVSPRFIFNRAPATKTYSAKRKLVGSRKRLEASSSSTNDSSDSSLSSRSITDKWLKEELWADDDEMFANIQTEQVTTNAGCDGKLNFRYREMVNEFCFSL